MVCFMDEAKLEITVGREVVFGLYPDGNVTIKDDLEYLATARERLTAALGSLSDYSEPPRAIGQVS
jgi:hypothetical protein